MASLAYSKYIGSLVWNKDETIIAPNINKANNFDIVFKVNPSQCNFKFRWYQQYFW